MSLPLPPSACVPPLARLRLTDLLGLFVRAWIAVWVVGILLGLLTSLLPLIIFAAGFLVILVGVWIFWRAVGSWFWFVR